MSWAAENIKVSALSEVPENLASLHIREIPKRALRQTRYAKITDFGRAYVECHSTFDGRDLKRLIGQFSVSLKVLTLGPRGRNEAYPKVAVHFFVPTTSLTRKRDDSRPISSCPDHLTFLLSRCVRSQGAQAWSAVRKSPRTGDRSIRWGECADNELGVDCQPDRGLEKHDVRVQVAWCISWASFARVARSRAGQKFPSVIKTGFHPAQAAFYSMEAILTDIDGRLLVDAQSLQKQAEASRSIGNA